MRLLPSLPLLTKELIEQAVRKRTYALRSAYALALLIGFGMAYTQALRNDYNGQGLLGQGRQLFDALFQVQFWSILVVMPALTAGAITQEKEQGSLTLLLLTSLSPWELLVQKWLSRLVTVGSFLLLSLPLMAVAYAYGGFDVDHLLIGILVLALTCLQTSAVALALSAWCRSSVAAFVCTYLVLAALYTVVPFVLDWLWNGGDQYFRRIRADVVVLFPYQVLDRGGYGVAETLADSVGRSGWILASIVAAIAFARTVLVLRAAATGANPLLRLFRWLDQSYEKLDVRLGRKRQAADLPERDPVAWREANRRSLCNWRYLIRLMIPTACVVLVFGLIGLSLIGRYNSNSFMAVMFLGLLCLGALLVLVMSAGLVAGERVDQTLDVLLTTPLSARDILVQKSRGLRRIILAVLAILCLPLFVHWYGLTYGIKSDWWPLASLFGVAALLPLLSWYGIWVGLVVRKRNQAVLVAVISVGVAIFGSLFGLAWLAQMIEWNDDSLLWLIGFVPGILVMGNEIDGIGNVRAPAVLILLTAYSFHLLLAFAIRWWCLSHADRYLRRTSAGT